MDAAPLPSAPEPLEPPARDWSLLPLDLLALVFVRLGAVGVLRGAGLACRSWLDAAKLPEVWRAVDMEYRYTAYSKLCAMAKAAVDRSDGQLRVFVGRRFVTEDLMQYIVERSPLLTTLRLVSCFKVFKVRLAGAIRESPLRELRSLELDNVSITVEELIAVLENCPVLEVLTVHDCDGMDEEDQEVLRAKFSRIKTLTFECYGVWLE